MDTKHKLLAAVAFVALVLPGISLAQAQSVATLQQEIASLTAQLQTLEAQLAAAGGSKATWCYTFNSNLSIGMSGSAVTALQTAIQKDGESVTANGTFDDQTAAAVTTFQQKYQSAILAPYGLSNGTGYAGKGTRTELNSLFGCTGSNPVTPPIVVNPIVPTSSPIGIACPMLVPYCPYGGHSVVESNGCTQEVCNQGPTPVTPAQTVSITSVNSKPNGDGYIIAGQSADIVGFGFLATDNVSLSEVSNNSESGSVATGQLVNGVISFTAPASLPAGQYTIMVSNANGTSNQLTVTVEAASPIATAAPYISQVNPTTAAPGATVTITGQNFDSNSFISLGNVPTGPENMPVAVITETPTSLTFVVPSSLVGAQPLYVAEHNSNLVSNEGTLTISAAPSTIYPIGCTSFSGYSSVNGQSCGCTSSSGYSSANGESCTPATAAPYISQVNPTTVAPGATVTITGQNFDSNSYISIGNVPTGPESEPLAVTSQTATSLTFMIPSNMSPATFPIYVAEHNSGLVSNEGSITILGAPYISNVIPATVTPGTVVEISGGNFDSNSYVSLGNVPTGPNSEPITPTSNNASTLTFTVPSNISVGTFPIYVAEHGSSLVSNGGTLTISATASAPYISQVNPTTVAPGATVTITGQNFDSNSYISIGNVPTGPESEPLAVTSQTATSLTFMIPSNMSPATFPIYVAEHNSGLVSNEGSITILAVSSTIYPAGCTSFSGYSSVNGQSCGSIN